MQSRGTKAEHLSDLLARARQKARHRAAGPPRGWGEGVGYIYERRCERMAARMAERMEDLEGAGPSHGWRDLLTSAARTVAVRYSILFPKFKAVGWMQPEDHVSAKNIAKSAHTASGLGHRFLNITHNASIFGAGMVLFIAQEKTLRKMAPESQGDFAEASTVATALSGAVGGASYVSLRDSSPAVSSFFLFELTG